MQEVIDKAVEVLDVIWTAIDFESMSNSRKKEIWSEFKSKVRAAAISSNNLIEFVDKICKKFNIQSVEKGYAKIVETYENDTENEIVEAYRSQLVIIMFKLRMMRDKKKEEYSKKQKEQAEKLKKQTEMYSDIPDDEFAF